MSLIPAVLDTDPKFRDFDKVTRSPAMGVTPGAYTAANITVDAYGRVTAAANGAGGGVTDGDKGDVVVSGSGATWLLDTLVPNPAGAYGGALTIAAPTVDAKGRVTSVSTYALGAMAGIADAASDGSTYGRKNGAWAAVLSVGTTAGTVAAGDDSRLSGADSAAITDGRFTSPLCAMESGVPTTDTVAGTTIAWTNPSPSYGGSAYLQSNTPLATYGAPAGFGPYRGTGFLYPGNRGTPSSTSSIRATATMPVSGTISFWYRYGTEAGWDKCYVYVDGVVVSSINGVSGTSSWARYTTATLASGAHTVDFVYIKDGSADSNGDAFLIDDVTVQHSPAYGNPPVDFCSNEYTLSGTVRTAGAKQVTSTNYTGATVYFEAVGNVDAAGVTLTVELYNLTDATTVKTLTFTSTTDTVATSTAVTLATGAKIYRVRISKSGGTTAQGGTCLSAYIKVT